MLNKLNAHPDKVCAFFIKQNAVQKLVASYDELTHVLQETLSQDAYDALSNVRDSIKTTPDLFFSVVLLYDRISTYIRADDGDGLERLLLGCAPSFAQTPHKDSYIFTLSDAKIPEPLIHTAQTYLVSELEIEATIAATSDEGLRHMRTHIAIAQDVIQAVSRDFFDEYQTLVNGILIVQSKRFIAGSCFPLLSLITLADRHDVDMTVDYLVHETAHQFLYYLMLEDEICAGSGYYTSPLRKDPRPIEGIYHAVFVLARLVNFFKQAQRSSEPLVHKYLPASFLAEQIHSYTERFYDGLKIVEDHGTMTDLGRRLLDSAKTLVSTSSA